MIRIICLISCFLAALLLIRTARQDACLLSALSFPRLLLFPEDWFKSLLIAFSLSGILFISGRLYRLMRGEILVGGGDIKLIFSCFLLIPCGRRLFFLEALVLYSGLLIAFWHEKRRLPLGTAIAAAALLCLLPY